MDSGPQLPMFVIAKRGALRRSRPAGLDCRAPAERTM